MSALERRIHRHLVIDQGFSRRNAETAVEMMRAGELTKHEMVVMNYIMLNPEPRGEEMRVHMIPGSNPVMWVANHLNYRITQAGGDAKTPSRIK